MEDRGLWLGLNQLSTFSQGFIWADGSPLNFINWQKGEPNDAHGGEKCVEMIPNCKFLVFLKRCVESS